MSLKEKQITPEPVSMSPSSATLCLILPSTAIKGKLQTPVLL